MAPPAHLRHNKGATTAMDVRHPPNATINMANKLNRHDGARREDMDKLRRHHETLSPRPRHLQTTATVRHHRATTTARLSQNSNAHRPQLHRRPETATTATASGPYSSK